MRFTSAVVGMTATSLALAAPVHEKRALSESDTNTLKLALYLENLEQRLYTLGCNDFTDAQYQDQGFPPSFRENVCLIAEQEQVHINTITQVLTSNGQAGFGPCTYQFPFSDPTTFVNLANSITTVGIGAYIGGAMNLVDNVDLLTAASSILTNEGRHDAYLRSGVGASPYPTPFDTPLTALYAYTLAQNFVVSCPPEAVLPIIPTPKLTLTSPAPSANLQPPVAAGTTVTFAWDPSTFFVTVDPNAPLFIAMINQIAPPVFQQVTKTSDSTGTVIVPEGLGNVAFAVLTTFSGGLTEVQLSQFGTLAGPAEVVLS